MATQQSKLECNSRKKYRTWQHDSEMGEPRILGVFIFNENKLGSKVSNWPSSEQILYRFILNLHIQHANKNMHLNVFKENIFKLPKICTIAEDLVTKIDLSSKLKALESYRPTGMKILRWDEELKNYLLLSKFFEYLIERDRNFFIDKTTILNFPVITISHSFRLQLSIKKFFQQDAEKDSSNSLYILSRKSEIAKILNARFKI